jgi:hypothetical protein
MRMKVIQATLGAALLGIAGFTLAPSSAHAQVSGCAATADTLARAAAAAHGNPNLYDLFYEQYFYNCTSQYAASGGGSSNGCRSGVPCNINPPRGECGDRSCQVGY